MDQPKDWNVLTQDPVSRRQFVIGGAGTLAEAALLLGYGPAEAAAVSSRKVIHVIGHSHIDAAWLWPWTDASDFVLNTFRSALDRMQETPGFCYSHSSVIHYAWARQADPAMFREIGERMREGRWEAVGGWPVEPDCNIPSTESFARHCLYGKRLMREMLDANIEIGFNPDSFGHGAGLPTILKNAGYRYYVFMRPQEHEMTLPRLFWWEGPDGSRILTYHIYQDYDGSAKDVPEASAHVIPDGFEDGAFFLGVGDHGGAVTREQIRDMLALQADRSLPELRWSTLRTFFAALEASPAIKNVPVVRGDLQHHARGCYSACGEEKFQNRRAEHELTQAESIGVARSLFYHGSYPAPEFANAWRRVLFTQFHDTLAGTALYSDYQDARDAIGLACDIAGEKKHADLQIIARQVDLHDLKESAVFAYNPLPWPRKALLEYRCSSGEMADPYTHLRSHEGTSVPLQERPSDSMTNFFPRLSAWVPLPACGYKVFSVERGTQPPAAAFSSSFTVANDAFGLSSMRADDGTELLSSPLGLVVIEDKSDTWAHGIDAFRTELGRPTFVSSNVAESGPVTQVTRQTWQWRSSKITVDVAEFAGLDFVQLRFVIDWHEREQILKLEIPTSFHTPSVFAKVPGAAIRRTPNGNEEPYQDWVALEGSLNGQIYTVALVNNSTYSYDCLNGLLRTVLVRSAPYARHNPNLVKDPDLNAWQDQGRQERFFWLLRGKGSYSDMSLDRRSLELQTPCAYVLDSRHSGSQPWERSFLELAPDNIEVLAWKGAEDDNSTILRLQERSGKKTTAHIRSTPLHLDEQVELQPWELKTLSITRAGTGKTVLRTVSVMEG